MMLPPGLDDVNRECFPDKIVIFIQMLHLHCICLSPLFVSRCQHPPCKSVGCGRVGVGEASEIETF